ncbi:MAG: tRNA (adenosine(37)-N6)-threonylcarbamoyltransferase complex dimerization subunit type 1 TsaB [Acidobacteria bacterium]|nr:tRNA (adenosine(37)-N6)-threonylcarbamoyltransferase complex dimerization subunit type 1 TsaB [Acidobacteriota bacterium]
MFILSIDTSTRSGSVALLKSSRVRAVRSTSSDEPYSSRMFREVDELLRAENFSLAQIDVFAVASGPGSFTGLRVGLTAAKAWAEVYGKPIVAVSGLAAVAAQSQSSNRWLAAMVDANRGQFFAALYDRQKQDFSFHGEEEVVSAEEFFAHVRAKASGGSVGIVSSTPEAVSTAMKSPYEKSLVLEVASPVLAPVIGQLAALLYKQGKFVDALALDANYVRRSDAEIFWKGSEPHVAIETGSQAFTEIPDGRIRIRPLSGIDVEAVQILAPQTEGGAAWRQREFLESDKGDEIGQWVAERNKQIIGYLCTRAIAGEMEILDIVVAPNERRKSVGKALMQKLFQAAGAERVQKVFLEVRESNAGAISFYERHGFKRAGCRREYYNNPREDALLYSFSLS